MNGPPWLPSPDKWPPNIDIEPSTESRAQAKETKEVLATALPMEDEFSELVDKHSKKNLLWRRANSRNGSFQSLYSGQFTLSTQLINPKFCVSRPHRRSTTVSVETNPLTCYVIFVDSFVFCWIDINRAPIMIANLGFESPAAWLTGLRQYIS